MLDLSTVITICSVAVIFAFAVSLYFVSNPTFSSSSQPVSNAKGNNGGYRKNNTTAGDESTRSPGYVRKGRNHDNQRDSEYAQQILASITWRSELKQLCAETAFHEGDFDPRSLRLLDEYNNDDRLDLAMAALRESVENQPRNNILNTRRYVYTLLRRVDRDVYGKYKLKIREERNERQKDSPGKPTDDNITPGDMRDLIGQPVSEPREIPPATRTKSNADSPGKLHEFNVEAEEFTPGNRSHGCAEFIPGAISHGLIRRTALMPSAC